MGGVRVTREEYEQHILTNQHGKFYPHYTLEVIESENNKGLDYRYTITKSAEEVYNEWLQIITCPPKNTEQKIEEVNKILTHFIVKQL